MIITLTEPVVLGDKAIPVCLPTEDMDDGFLTGKTLTVSGWGDTQQGGSQPVVLHSVEVPFVPTGVCNTAYNGVINDVMVCAGNITHGEVDSCQGDSGGTLSKNNI